MGSSSPSAHLELRARGIDPFTIAPDQKKQIDGKHGESGEQFQR